MKGAAIVLEDISVRDSKANAVSSMDAKEERSLAGGPVVVIRWIRRRSLNKAPNSTQMTYGTPH